MRQRHSYLKQGFADPLASPLPEVLHLARSTPGSGRLLGPYRGPLSDYFFAWSRSILNSDRRWT